MFGQLIPPFAFTPVDPIRRRSTPVPAADAAPAEQEPSPPAEEPKE